MENVSSSHRRDRRADQRSGYNHRAHSSQSSRHNLHSEHSERSGYKRVAPNVGVDAAELLGTITDRESQADFLKNSFLLRLQSL